MKIYLIYNKKNAFKQSDLKIIASRSEHFSGFSYFFNMKVTYENRTCAKTKNLLRKNLCKRKKKKFFFHAEFEKS